MGGFSHCTWMCAPFVLAQTDDKPTFRKFSANLLLPYHFGRMTTYVLLAILVSSVINLAFVFSDMKSLIAVPLLIIAGLIFMVSAFPRLAEIFPWVMRVQAGVPYKYISNFVSKASQYKGFGGRYLLGVLLGFMPCGLVVSALMASATAPNVYLSALAMGAFTLGTVPALMMVAFGGQAFKYKYPKMSAYLSRGGMVISSIWLFALAGMMIF